MRITSVARLAPLAVLVAGTLALPAAAQAKGSATSVCKGAAGEPCNATFSLAGGASDKQLTVNLPDTDYKLVQVFATPSWVDGAYQLGSFRYSLGGSVATTTLNAVQSIPKGAKLTLRFGTPERLLNCGGIRTGVSSLIVEKVGAGPASAFGCPQAAGVGKTWLKRFNAFQQVERFSVSGVSYRCALVPHPSNVLCRGGGTYVSFGGPTGH